MAHEDLTIKFWEWSQTGAYFGMPLRNFAGWTLTAFIFMAISRLIWRSDPKTNRMPMEFPFVVYLVNSIFAMALSASVDLWIPILLSIVLGVFPAWLAIKDQFGLTTRTVHACQGRCLTSPGKHCERVPIFSSIAMSSLTVSGLDQVPQSGPAILSCRHFHHLYDGCALLSTIERPLHPVVALDWITNPAGKIMMKRLCSAARWPVVYRTVDSDRPATSDTIGSLRDAVELSVKLLDEGRLMAIFPEGFPNVDPGSTPKLSTSDWLRFEPGAVRLARLASTRQGAPVPLIPVGLHYQEGPKWKVSLRFGTPMEVTRREDEARVLADLEQEVQPSLARLNRSSLALDPELEK